MSAIALPPGCNFVDAFVIDVNGQARGKRLPATDFLAVADKGVAFSASCLVLDARGAAQGPLGIGTADGDPDALGVPVAGSIHPVPWSSHRVAQCLLSMRRDGAALWFDPREVLAGVLARLAADGLYPMVACELEFYLVDQGRDGRPRGSHNDGRPRGSQNDGRPRGSQSDGRPRPGRLPLNWVRPGHAGHLCLQRVEDHGDFLHAVHAALAAQGIEAGTLVSEYGPGQFEVNLRHGPDPLAAADEAVLLKRAVLGVAASQGQRASFMSKPYADQPGSGMHVHVSLVDADGRNRFGADGGQDLLEQAIGGMRALHAESMAFFAPSFSAWRRFQPGAFVSGASDWAENSRAVALRIPPGGASSRRIEHRVAGADASPHLVMAAILAGLHHGITQRLRPDAAVAPLPRNIYAALERLEQGTALAGYLPAQFPALFAALRGAETAALLAEPSAAEYDFYL